MKGSIRDCHFYFGLASFTYHYPWKESVDFVDFLHGDNHQRKAASETTTFLWVCPVLQIGQSDYGVI